MSALQWIPPGLTALCLSMGLATGPAHADACATNTLTSQACGVLSNGITIAPPPSRWSTDGSSQNGFKWGAANWSAPLGQSSLFRFGYGATAPLLNLQSAGTDARGSGQSALQISQQIDLATGGVNEAIGMLSVAGTVNGSPSTDYWAILATQYVQNLADVSPPPGGSQHGAIAAQSVKTLAQVPPGNPRIPVGRTMPDMWAMWWVTKDETGLPSSEGGANVGLEYDIAGNNKDDNGNQRNRFARQTVLDVYTPQDAGGLPLEYRYGDYWNSHTGYPRDTFFNSVIALYAGYTVAGIDMSRGTQERCNYYAVPGTCDKANGLLPAVAIKLQSDLRIAYNGDGVSGSFMTHSSARNALEYWSGGVPATVNAAAVPSTMKLQVTDAGALTVAGNAIRVSTSSSPASGSACQPGTINWDGNYVYVCVAVNTWKRAALSAY